MVKHAAVPGFDHRDTGTAEEVWSSSGVLDAAQTLHLRDFEQVVVVAAHPDDESLGAGGLLAAATRLGLATAVLIATLGERSHPDSPTHGPADLRRIRRAEVFAALGAVAPDTLVRIVGFPDGELSSSSHRLTDAIGALIRGPHTLVVAPWRGDGHPDHHAAGRAAADAAKAIGATLLEYPIWAWHWAQPGDLPSHLTRLDLNTAEVAAKTVAVASHRSQTEPLSDLPGDEPIVPPAFAAHFARPFEIFFHSVAGPPGVTLPRTFFDEFYGDSSDPWGFTDRWYEKRKRALTLAALPRTRFVSAFEPGCSIGVLTAELAARCDSVLATDISERPLAIARRRLHGLPGVRLELLPVPSRWPSGKFDLIALSEVGYYCGAADFELLLDLAVASMTADGVLVACHWRHPVPEYPLTGDQVHAALGRRKTLALLANHIEDDFRLQVYVRPPAVSVARATGLVL